MRCLFFSMLVGMSALVGLSAAGCKSEAPVCDPFFGRTTIPPPSTGSVTGNPADPCYQPPPLTPHGTMPGPAVGPPQVQLPNQPTTQTPPSLAPPGVALPPASASPLPAPSVPPMVVPGTSTPQSFSPPPGAPMAPRPSSTAPAVPGMAPGSPSTAPGSPYAPPGNSYNYRGASLQGALPSASGQISTRGSSSAYTNVGTTHAAPAREDRLPRPVDGSGAPAAATGQTPIVRTLTPRGQQEGLSRVVDIVDLPKLP
jgi:hypothetical protein